MTVGLAVVLAVLVEESPVEGDHEKVGAAEVAVSRVELPLQITGSGLAVTVGAGKSTSETALDFEQPFASVPTTVYVVFAVGVATGFGIFGLESVDEGVQA